MLGLDADCGIADLYSVTLFVRNRNDQRNNPRTSSNAPTSVKPLMRCPRSLMSLTTTARRVMPTRLVYFLPIWEQRSISGRGSSRSPSCSIPLRFSPALEAMLTLRGAVWTVGIQAQRLPAADTRRNNYSRCRIEDPHIWRYLSYARAFSKGPRGYRSE